MNQIDNSRLIASNHELIAALRYCSWVMSTWLLPGEEKNSTDAWDKALEKARVAIAKAEGEQHGN